jgi:hypothetical protein
LPFNSRSTFRSGSCFGTARSHKGRRLFKGDGAFSNKGPKGTATTQKKADADLDREGHVSQLSLSSNRRRRSGFSLGNEDIAVQFLPVCRKVPFPPLSRGTSTSWRTRFDNKRQCNCAQQFTSVVSPIHVLSHCVVMLLSSSIWMGRIDPQQSRFRNMCPRNRRGIEK